MKEQIIEKLKGIKDVDFIEYDDSISVTIDDFEGFDENWSEIIKDYDDEGLLDFLEEHALKVVRDFYTEYEFDGFFVQVGYSSYDI